MDHGFFMSVYDTTQHLVQQKLEQILIWIELIITNRLIDDNRTFSPEATVISSDGNH